MKTPIKGGAPERVSLCGYCGEREPAARASCCGERHFEQVAGCPCCGDDVDCARRDTAGIETYVYSCQSCDWESDPE